ncbi:MAG TPA: phenylalanine--tRNA ligase subunit beta, partial [Proteobacteria bacterium]|nr:phenylalanine--tRNA ligase subunit beta [Pseudomonadota bacterium]
MRVPLSWLKEYVDIEESPTELADLLTMAGLEVEDIIHRGQGLDDVITVRIVEIKPHPNADRLQLAYVDTGSETLQVVCGAPNIYEGAVVPLALPGADLPGGVRIQKAKIRGEESVGMLCSQRDLGISDDHSGIMILTDDVEPGKPFAQAAFVEDVVLEVAITPNRGDCLSIVGIAREVAAIKRRKLKLPKIRAQITGEEINRYIAVDVENPDGCPRYVGLMVRGGKVGPSPRWMQARLEAVGLRPISNIVDVTNYVLFEFGQPLHAFDAEKLRDRRIVVRNAKDGETIALLDGTERTMTEDDLLICDGAGPVAIAGIMGGSDTEVDENSEDIFIESAYFNPRSIRRTSKRLGLVTESSYRFERGVDPDGVPLAAQRAAQLMVQLAGGRTVGGRIDVYPKPIRLKPVNLRISRVNHLLGTELKGAEVKEILLALGMELKPVSADLFVVQPPSHRTDITREVDLIEEIARLWGYD